MRGISDSKIDYNIRIKKFLSIIICAAKKELLIIILLSVMEGLTSPISLWISQYFINELADSLTQKIIRKILIILLVLMLGVSILQSIISSLADIVQTKLSDEISIYITEDVLSKVSSAPMEIFDDADTYNKIKMTIQETPDRCLLIVSSVEGLIKSIIQFVGVFVILIKLQWLIGIVPVFILIPMFFLRCKVSKNWFRIQGDRIGKLRYTDELKNLLIRNENIKELRLFDMSSYLSKKITALLKRFNGENLDNAKKYGSINVMTTIVTGIYSFGVKMWIILMGIRRQKAIGSISMYINAIDTYGASVDGILQQISTINEQFMYVGCLCEIDDMPREEHDDLIELDEDIYKIEFRNVYFKYRNTKEYVLKNVSLILEKNHMYALVGMNGSGKSTLIKLLMKIYLPSKGSVFVNGYNIETVSGSSIRKKMSSVFQDFIKYPFTISENICLKDCKINEDHLKIVSEKTCISDKINNLPQKYNTQLKCEWESGVDLSGGQWQKLAVARCLYRMASVYIFDEPFSWIDQITKDKIMDETLLLRENKIVILVSHQYDIMPLFDQIIVFEKGEVLETGTHEELVKNRKTYYYLINNCEKKW